MESAQTDTIIEPIPLFHCLGLSQYHYHTCNLLASLHKTSHLFTVLSSIRERVYGISYRIGRPSTLDLESVTAIDQPNSEQMPDYEGDDRL